MEKKAKYLIVLSLFKIGDMVSKSFKYDKLLPVTYPIYNWCMIASVNLQDKFELDKPWNKV